MDDLKHNRPPPKQALDVMARLGTKYVSPQCSSASAPAHWVREVRSPERCQECKATVVPNDTHGLNCSNGAHRVCWACLVKGVNWQAAAKDPSMLQDINDNLVIHASQWR